jgi:hypothetical protein
VQVWQKKCHFGKRKNRQPVTFFAANRQLRTVRELPLQTTFGCFFTVDGKRSTILQNSVVSLALHATVDAITAAESASAG